MAASRNRPPDLFDRVAAFVATHLPPGADLCVGLSGGCDSVALLHLLSRAGLGPRLSALHVHHGLSPDADAWVAHCQSLCDRLLVPLAVRRVHVRPDGTGIEAAARAARYAAFASHPAGFVALGHHRDDQAETVLFNLLRGSGLPGLAGMRAVRPAGRQTYLRPLLDVPRADLEDYAGAHGLAWVTDGSNADPRFTRNFLRNEILPRLSGHFPAAGASLARAAGHVAEAADLLAALAEMDWAACEGDAHSIALAPARRLGASRLKHLVRHGLRQRGWRAPASERLDEFIRQVLSAAPDRHPALDLAEGRLRVSGRRLHWEPRGA